MVRLSPIDGIRRRDRQRGAALLLTLALIGLLIAIFVVVLVNDLVRENQRRRQTTEALAKAKEALIGFAVSVNLNPAPSCTGMPNCVRPGDLPCPDLNDNGEADDGNCSTAAGGNQERRIGRLPWKTLGLPDLRDGDGERLWYAVSNNFQNTSRTECDNPGDAGCLNSETAGTITLRDRNGTVVSDGSDPKPGSGLVAVVISPGMVLQRDDAGSSQDRSCSGGSCDPDGACTSSPASLTAKCNPVNYLDIVSGSEDNANFVDGSGTNGFRNGPAFLGNGAQIVNDTALGITYADVMPLLERRVAKEAMNCLTAFGATSEARYPWAASVADSATGNYGDQPRYRFGRLPDTFDFTLLGIETDILTINLGNLVCSLLPFLCDKPKWPAAPSCNLTVGSWWINWKDQVFYGVAEGYRPNVNIISLQLLPPGINLSLVPVAGGTCTTAGNCMTVNPPSATADKQAVIIVAGPPLAGAGQPVKPAARDRTNAAHYLEGVNPVPGNTPTATTNFTFQQGQRSATFNDTVLYQ